MAKLDERDEIWYRGFMCIGRFCIGLIHLAFWHMYFGDLSGLESNTLASFTHKLAFHAKHGSVQFQLRGPIVATRLGLGAHL